MSLHTAGLTLRIKGPLLSAGLDGAAFGIDDTNLVASDRETLILPESLVRGVIVHVLRDMSEHFEKAGLPQVADLEKVRGWLGTCSAKGSFEPNRRRIRLDDLELNDGGAGRQIVRIKLDPNTGSTAHGAMQVLASPLDYGELGTFKGAISFELSHRDAELACTWIKKALAFVPAIGALKSSGFGRVAGYEIAPVRAVTSSVASSLNAASLAFRYAITLDRPFLVASEAISGNLFKGAIDIPGAAIKGVLADQLKARGVLTGSLMQALDQLTFRHAKPVANVTKPRPRAIPLSLYGRDGELLDALAACPAEAGMAGAYVEFKGDWKPGCAAEIAAETVCARTFSPRYDIRTRTAVKDGTAEDAKLFTRMAVEPADHLWVGAIERPKGIGDKDIKAILEALTGGIAGLGKTRANATVKWLDAQPCTARPVVTNGSLTTWRVVLETDALLHGPGDPEHPLADHYRHYFENVTGGTFDSFKFYSAQRWIGGYQAGRFPHFKDCYYPQLLTIAGSVFQFACNGDITDLMTQLARFGLPLPEAVGKGHKFQYERSAFNPENGYGEVSIEARALTEPVTEA